MEDISNFSGLISNSSGVMCMYTNVRRSLLITSLNFLFAYQVCRSSATMAKFMRSVKQEKFGGADELSISNESKVPLVESNQILIRIHATALNRADLLMRAGRYPGMKSLMTLGLEAAGTVDAVGNNCTKWKVGENVMALLNGGGYAEYAAVNEDHVMAIPKHLTFHQAAAIPEVWLTAFQLLHFVGGVAKDETVLIHGGGSGVGTAAIQLAKLAGAKTIVTAGTSEKIAKAKTLGALEGINYKQGDFDKKVIEITGGKGVNLILDCVGGSFWKQNAECLAMEGRWVVYGLMGGSNIEGPLFQYVLAKRASIFGTTLKTRSDAYKGKLISEFSKQALPHFKQEENALQPIIDKVFDLESVVSAHKYMESNKSNGKIILAVRDHIQDEL